MAVLDDIRLKLSQAENHLDTLSAEIRETVEEYPTDFRVQENQLDDSYSVFLKSVPEVRREWGVMLGDFLHNTRGALDHLVCALVLAGGGKIGSRHQFPICKTAQLWEKEVGRPPRGNGRLGLIDPSLVEVIESLQPYQPSTGLKSLLILQSFSNADKHRLVHGSVISAIDVTVSSIRLIPMTVTPVFYITSGMPLQEGANVARFKTGRLVGVDLAGNLQIPDAGQQTNIRLKLTTAFGEPGHEDTRIRDFRRCLTDAIGIVERFASVLTST